MVGGGGRKLQGGTMRRGKGSPPKKQQHPDLYFCFVPQLRQNLSNGSDNDLKYGWGGGERENSSLCVCLSSHSHHCLPGGYLNGKPASRIRT